MHFLAADRTEQRVFSLKSFLSVSPGEEAANPLDFLKQLLHNFEILCFDSISESSIVTDLAKVRREDMLNKEGDELFYRHSPIANRNVSSWLVGKGDIGSFLSGDATVIKDSSFRDRRSFGISSNIGDSEIFIRKLFAVMHVPVYGKKRVEEGINNTGMGEDRKITRVRIFLKILFNRFLKIVNKEEPPSFIEHLKGEGSAMFPLIESFSFK